MTWYHQLKKVINRIVNELSSLGLKPALLHELIEASEGPSSQSLSSPPPTTGKGAVVVADYPSVDTTPSALPSISDDPQPSTYAPLKLSQPRVVYELNSTSGKIEPQLRIWIRVPKSARAPDAFKDVFEGDEGTDQENQGSISDHTTLLWRVQRRRLSEEAPEGGTIVEVDNEGESVEQVRWVNPLSFVLAHG